MIKCPVETDPNFQSIVREVGIDKAYDIYRNEDDIPRIGVAPNGKPSEQYTKLPSEVANKWWLVSKTSEYKTKFNPEIDSNGESIIELTPEFKDFANSFNGDVPQPSYISSSSEAVNEAMTATNTFIKKVAAATANMAKQYKSTSIDMLMKGFADTRIRDDIGINDLGNLAEALKYTLDYFQETMYIEPNESRKGGIMVQLNKYGKMKMEDILKDPKVTSELDSFLKHASTFVDNYSNVEKLEHLDGGELMTEGEEVINNMVSQLQSFTGDVANARNKLSKLLEKRFEEDLMKYTTNPELLDGMRKMFDVGDDENMAQYMLNALADTNNPFIGNMMKKYHRMTEDARHEYTDKSDTLRKLLKDTFGRNPKDLTDKDFEKYLEHRNGERTGRYAQKFDWERFDREKSDYFESIKNLKRSNPAAYREKAKDWYENNEVSLMSQDEIKNTIDKKRGELSSRQFIIWANNNFRFIDGKYRTRLGNGIFREPHERFQSDNWESLKNDKLYQFFINETKNITDSFGKDSILSKGYIPSEHLPEETEGIRGIVDAFLKSGEYKQKNASFIGTNDQIVRLLNTPMDTYYKDQDTIKIRPKGFNEDRKEWEQSVLADVKNTTGKEFTNVKDIYNENRRIIEENKKTHAESINYNLASVFDDFLKAGTTFKYKQSMKNQFDLAARQLNDMKFHDRDSKGSLIKNKAASDFLNDKILKTKSGEGTNLQKHYEEWLEAIFYDNFNIDEGAFTQIAHILQNYVSAKNMWLNVTAGINVAAFGHILSRTEAISGFYFTNKDMMQADKKYITSIWDLVAHTGQPKESLVGQICDYFNMATSHNEQADAASKLKDHLMSTDSLYFMNNMSVHLIQNIPLLSMVHSHRLVDGRIMSLNDYKFRNSKNALAETVNDEEKQKLEIYYQARLADEDHLESKKDYMQDFVRHQLTPDKQDEYVKNRKALDELAEKEFEQYPQLIDKFSIGENGRLAIDPEIDKQVISDFSQRVLRVTQRNHGIYNSEDRMMLQRRVIGRFVTAFRKFVKPGWDKRFGAKFMQSYWSESRGSYDVPMYKSTLNYIGDVWRGNNNTLDLEDGDKITKFMSRLLPDFANFGRNAKLYWHTLDDIDKANVRKTVAEMGYLALTVLVAGLGKGLAKNMNNPVAKYATQLALYQNDNLFSDLLFYTPLGLTNEGKKILDSPAAVGTAITDTYKFLRDSIEYPLEDDKSRLYKTGIYNNELKVKVDAIRLIPGYNKWLHLQHMAQYNKYYMLFRG